MQRKMQGKSVTEDRRCGPRICLPWSLDKQGSTHTVSETYEDVNKKLVKETKQRY